MRGISRTGIVLVLLLAALVAAQSILHNHPLIPAGPSDHGSLNGNASLPCPACAIGADRIRIAPPVIVPAVILYLLAAFVTITTPAATVLALSSRAPPAA